MVSDRDLMVRMRDGVDICVDVYRPDAAGKFPALLAFATIFIVMLRESGASGNHNTRGDYWIVRFRGR